MDSFEDIGLKICIYHCPNEYMKICEYEKGTNNYQNHPGHMSNKAAMPIYGKKLQNASSPEIIDRLTDGF